MDVLKTTAVFLAIDAVYLGVIQGEYMKKYFSHLNGSPFKLKLFPGLLAWALLGWGLEHFILSKGYPLKKTLTQAALLGILIYGVYDLTNLATISKWTVQFTLMDMIWGGVVMSLVAYIRMKWVR